MKIIFVNLCDYQAVYKNHNLPLGLLSLSTVIKGSTCHEAKVIDFNFLYSNEDNEFEVSKVLKENIKQDAMHLLAEEPDVISIYTMCNTYHIALLLAEKIKSLDNRVIVLFGGPQATAVAEKTLRKYSFVDGIGLGEGENTIVNILDCLESGDLSQVKGLAFREGDKIVLRYNDELIQDLNQLPMLDLSTLPVKILKSIDLDIGRGCPYSCIFCSTKLFWKRKFRIKSAKRIFNEILFYKNNFGVEEFNFQHDLFVANRKLVIELCDMLMESKMDIKWYCSARVDTVDEELLLKMHAAGCNSIFFGIESGVEKTQKYIKKNLDISQIEKLPLLLKKTQIEGTLSFIYGFPEETKEDINDNLMFIYNLIDKYHDMIIKEQIKFQLHKLIFLPNTELTERHKHELVHNSGYSMEIYQSLDQWGDEELMEIIRDSELFPNLCCIPGSLAEKYQHLDKFFSYVFKTSILLFDITYKLLLEETQGDFLKVYQIFQSAADRLEINRFYEEFQYESYINNEFIIKVFEYVINNNTFIRIDSDAINDMFNFECDIYHLLYKLKNEKKEIDVIKEYGYDVIQMRKNRITSYVKKPTSVRFYTENGKYIMKKVEEEKNLFSFMNPKLMSELQTSI